ncbi:MAG: TetR family transcriptional regulator [Bacillales bacterium]|jgi:AcrR family transcriptional regulator|nr:TetR family transcriptional regulator [Bacillales bacterium]
MKNKKQHVVETAERLFKEKGYQATSIQDIIEASQISKGTFYNYFTAKNELVIEVFHDFIRKAELDRDALLDGKDPSDITIFIKQVESFIGTGRKQGFMTLFEELINSPEVEAKKLMTIGKLRMIRWLQHRFTDIFGEDKKPYLLDCAIMFLGLLTQNIHFSFWTKKTTIDKSMIVAYSVNRLIEMVQALSKSGEQLFEASDIEKIFDNFSNEKECLEMKMNRIIQNIKKELEGKEVKEAIDWLDFILEEMTKQKSPRKFLVENAVQVLEGNSHVTELEEFKLLKEFILID